MKRIFKTAFLITTLFNFVSCSSWFQGKIDMDVDISNVSIEDLFFVKSEIKTLDTPEQLFVSQGLNADAIEIKWSEVENATSYRIERAVVKEKNAAGGFSLPDESDFEVLVSNCYSTSYRDTILTNVQYSSPEYDYHYFYRISAENFELSIESDPTDFTQSETRGEGWLFAAPKQVEAEKGKATDSVGIVWNAVENASYYKIYRSEKENGLGSELIDRIYGNQSFYTNAILYSEQGTEFYYQIAAVNIYGNESPKSSIAMGYSLKEGAPSAPGNVRVLNGLAESKSKFVVAWDSVTTTGEVSYTLFRSSSVDSAYTQVKNGLTSTTYTEESEKLLPGIVYYYFVQTISTDTTTGEKIKSPFSEKTEQAQGFLLSPPSEFEVADSELAGNVLLIWSPAVGSDSVDYTYNVYFSDTEDGVYAALATNVTGRLNEDGKYEFEFDKKNYYCISTWNEASTDAKESKMSMIAAPVPEAPENVTASKTLKLATDFVPNKNNVYPVLVTWEKPANDNPAGYIVYRSVKPDSSFRKITDEPVTGLSYTDQYESAKSGTVYYYKVVSVNTLGQGKKSNNPEEDLLAADGSGPQKVKCLGYGALTADQWFREYNKTVMNSQKKLTLMHKPVDTDKLGKETINGTISGTLSYDAHLSGLGAEIIMPYVNYADFYINNEKRLGIFMLLNGNNDTSSNMSGNGSMSGTVNCKGMYPGKVNYGSLEIKSGAAGGGYYGLDTYDLNGSTILSGQQVDWKVGEEGR